MALLALLAGVFWPAGPLGPPRGGAAVAAWGRAAAPTINSLALDLGTPLSGRPLACRDLGAARAVPTPPPAVRPAWDYALEGLGRACAGSPDATADLVSAGQALVFVSETIRGALAPAQH